MVHFFQRLWKAFWFFIGAMAVLQESYPAIAVPLSFVLDAPDSREAEATLIAAQLAEAGVEVDIRLHSRAELRELISQGTRQAYLTDWGSSFLDPYDLVVPKLTTGGRGNFSFFSDARVDALLTEAATSADPQLRTEAYHRVQAMLAGQSPWAFGYVRNRFEAATRTVLGYRPSMDGRIHLHDVRLAEGETLIVAMNTSAFVSLDPAGFRDRETETVIRNMFDALVTRTPDGEVAMELAASYVSPTAETYEFTLRPGVRFHHGALMTAADVVFTFERILNPYGVQGKSSPRRDLLGPLQRVEALAPDKVRFTLGKPFPLFLQALVHFQIIPKQYIQEVGDQSFGEHPSGTGPFRFTGGRTDTEIILEPFADYYGGSPALPPVAAASLKRVIFRPVPDAGQRIGLLNAEPAVIATDIPDGQVETLRKDSRLELKEIAGTRSFQMELNNTLPPFNDIRLRKAVSLALDWPRIIEVVYLGHARQLATCFLPEAFGYDPALRPLERNLGAARLLLQAAGYASSQPTTASP